MDLWSLFWESLYDLTGFEPACRRLSRQAQAREAARREAAVWRLSVVETLVSDVLQPGVPYVYDAVFSWLQTDPSVLPLPRGATDAPAFRLTLFLPEVPLALDVLGPEYSERYEDAASYVDSRAEWEALQHQFQERRARLQQVGCPYLFIRYSDPVAAPILKERIRLLTDRRPA